MIKGNNITSSVRCIVFISCIFIIVCIYTNPGISNVNNNSNGNKNTVQFLSDAGLLIERGVFAKSDAGFTSLHQKMIDLTIFTFNDYQCSFIVKEGIYTTERFSNYFYPYRIEYQMDYFYFSKHLNSSSIGIVIDHKCYNTFDKTDNTGNLEFRWYGIGIKWESNGMGIGKKCIPSYAGYENILSVKNIQYSLYAGRNISHRLFLYDYLLSATLRYDFIVYPLIVPYCEGTLSGIIDNKNNLRVDRSMEIGSCFMLNNVILTPFMKYTYKHDALTYYGITDNMLFFGIRAESLLSQQVTTVDDTPKKYETPHLGFKGGYGKYFGSNYLGYRTDFSMLFKIFYFDSNSVFFISDIVHSTINEENALYPRFINYNLQLGSDIYFTDYLFTGFIYGYSGNYEGDFYNGISETYHSLGFILASKGNSTGTIANRQSLKRNYHKQFEWYTTIFYLFNKKNYPYICDIRIGLQYNIINLNYITPYISSSYNILVNNKNDTLYAVESGVYFPTYVMLSVYYRFQKIINIDRIDGISEKHHLIGLRIEL